MSFEPWRDDDEYETAATRPRPRRRRVGRRAERRRYAILGALAEHGPQRTRDVAKCLRIGLVETGNQLLLLEKQGRVVSELTLAPPGEPLPRFYRLPHEWERRQDGR